MPKFGKSSTRRLGTCHPDLQIIMNHAIARGPDFSILCGHRSEEEQNKAYRQKRSQLKWPLSKHNSHPSKAIDIAPYPIDWNDWNRFRILAGYILAIADTLYSLELIEHRLTWGGDWDRDYQESDERFRDLPHFELTKD